MLVGSKVLLRAPLVADEEFLFEIRNDVELQLQLMTLPRANSMERVSAWLARHCSDPAALFYVIASIADNAAVGVIQLTRMDCVHGRGELGICLAERYRGRGFAAEGLQLLEEYARSVFRLRKFVLMVLDSNKRAVALYERAGYTTAGVLKEHHYLGGAFHDVRLMEKLLTGMGK